MKDDSLLERLLNFVFGWVALPIYKMFLAIIALQAVFWILAVVAVCGYILVSCLGGTF